MPLDSNGHFYPVFPGMPAFAPSDSTIYSGAGAPSNDLGNNGDVYVNISNGDIYTRSGGAWTLANAGTGATEIIAGVVDDPNGVHTPADTTKTALYFRDSAGNDAVQFWRWAVADQEWKDIITT